MRAGRRSTVTSAQREELWRRYKAGEAVLWISRELGPEAVADQMQPLRSSECGHANPRRSQTSRFMDRPRL